MARTILLAIVALILSLVTDTYSQDSGCGTPKYQTGTSGNLSSMNYPNNYIRGANCEWQITAPVGYRIRLHVNEDFTVQGESDCWRANVRFVQPINNFIVVYCDTKLPPLDFFTLSNSITVKFITKSDSTPRSGFSITWTIFSASMESGCGGPMFLFGQSGSISSMNYPNHYHAFASCLWYIAVPVGNLKLQFNSTFGMEIKNGNCKDYVSASGTGRFCGTSAPGVVVSSTNAASVFFLSDGSNQFTGFSLSWAAVAVSQGGCGNNTQTGLSGSFSSMNYPSQYGANANCVWRISVPNGYRIRLHFNPSFALEPTHDTVTIYEESPASVTFGPYSGPTVPSDVLSYDNDVTVIFKSDRSTQLTGFNIMWTAIKEDHKMFGPNNGYTCHCNMSARCDSIGACPNKACDQGWYGEYCQTGNAAVGRPAYQSSTYDTNTAAGKAVDNDRNQLMSGGSCTLTAELPLDDQPWWKVDLGRQFALLNLTIYNRGNDGCESHASCKDRLKNFVVWMTDVEDPDSTKGNICVTNTGTVSLAAKQELSCDPPAAVGRYLYLKLLDDSTALSLCEVFIHAFQYRDCTGQHYGPNCNHRCRCVDRNEQCNSASGACVSKCADDYSGKYCETLMPIMKQPPISTAQTGSSVMVITPAWNKQKDGGDGVVLNYRLQYKTQTDSQWTNFTTEYPASAIASSSWNVAGLSNHNTIHQFRVVLFNRRSHEKDETWGRPGEARTVCPVVVTPKIKTITTGINSSKPWPSRAYLRVEIENFVDAGMPVSCFNSYMVHYNDAGSEFKSIVIQYQHTVNGLHPFTSYNVYMKLVDMDGKSARSTTSNKKTAEDTSGTVHSISVESSATTLKVIWSPPTSPNGVITSYKVGYKHLGYGPDGQCPLTASWVYMNTSGPVLEYTLTTCPYCLYDVGVAATNRAGVGLGRTSRRHLTTASQPTAPPPTPTISNTGSREVTFTWAAMPCENRNGPLVSYNYRLIEKSSGRENKSNEITSQTTVTLSALTPYTSYDFQVRFRNSAGFGLYTGLVAVTTEEEVPRAPSIEKAGSSLKSISVRVIPPVPPHGNISQYTIELWQTGEDKADNSVVNITSASRLTHMFNNLTTDTNYTFRAKGWTSKGSGAWSEEISLRTIEGIPGPPNSIDIINASVSSLKLRWTKPRFPNGVLKAYKLSCTPIFSYDNNINDNKDTYTVVAEPAPGSTEANLEGLKQATEYNCSISAQTSVDYGPAISAKNWTRPERDIFPTEWVSSVTIKGWSATTITLDIKEVPQKVLRSGKVKAIRVGVNVTSAKNLRRRRKRATALTVDEHEQLTGYEEAKTKGHTSYIAAELAVDFKGAFVIGDGTTHGGYQNPPLASGETYDVLYGIVTTAGGFTSISFSSMGQSIRVGAVNIGIAVGVPIAILIILVAVIVPVVLIVRKRRTRRNGNEANTETKNDVELLPVVLDVDYDMNDEVDNGGVQGLTEPERDPLDAGTNRSIACSDILSYNKKMKFDKSAAFTEEFKELPADLVRPCTIGQTGSNKKQNRYRNIVAYDHTRVILKPIGNEKSDYINANYIDGYDKKKVFIASQGPRDSHIIDMWRMIWQERCTAIVMLTNLTEQGREKCSQYWPSAGSVTHGPFKIELKKEEIFSDYVKRTMRISVDGDSRIVTHYHFIVWPDHGVPQFASSLLNLRVTVMTDYADNYGKVPLLVHCSAGVGRTGTLIAIDYLIRQGKVEKSVNVFDCVLKLREQRPNMVQNAGQYEHVHDAMAEYFKLGVTKIPSGEYPERYKALIEISPGKSMCNLNMQYKLLSTFANEDTLEINIDTAHPDKNRCQDIVPAESSRPILSMPVKYWDNYINAVYLTGFGARDNYIATQMPLPHTVKDIWRLVNDTGLSTIVMMNTVKEDDELAPIYWPNESEKVQYGPLVVEGKQVDTSHSDITIREFQCSRVAKGAGEKPARTVRHFHLQNWSDDQATPATSESVVELLAMVEKWQQRVESKQILVQCMDGASQSGVFCVAHSVIEKVKVDHEVDVFQYARLLRTNRPQLINTYEQYKFVHDVVLQYLSQFDIYANFN